MFFVLPALADPTSTTGLCLVGERVRLACEVAKGKQAALCQAGDALVYRFGKPGAVELELPAKGGIPIDVARQRLGEDAERHVASAWNDGHRYAIVSERTEDQFDLSVVVRKGADKPLATLACRKSLGVDFTETDAFRADPARLESWIGAWSGGEASFRIVKEGDGLALRDGEATWHGGGDRVHTGEASGALTRVGPDHVRMEADGCVIDIHHEPAGTLRAEDNHRCGGMNVSFSWTYDREP
ncbi:MAG: hypothetical protein KC621_12915 [Myxococcales bacterium]|nr:hypothetical protein [Myxococcales bacterium]